MSSRASAILAEIRAATWLALEVARDLPAVAGPWIAFHRRWMREHHGRCPYVEAPWPATRAMLLDADARLRERGVLLCGDAPAEGTPGVVPPCGEVHRMWLADGLRARVGAGIEATCDRPAGHTATCEGVGPGGRRFSAGNAVDRQARSASDLPARPRGRG